jgi:hypothetical protein
MTRDALETPRRLRLPLRLSTLPALSALTVLLIAGLSSWDLLFEKRGREDGLLPERPAREGLIPRSSDVPELGEKEALDLLDRGPAHAAVMRLWGEPAHRGRLRERLLSRDTREEIRLWLLGRFAAEEPRAALEAARAIARETSTPQGHLLSSAFEVLSRHGGAEDLSLFSERESENHQMRASREKHRDALRERAGGE